MKTLYININNEQIQSNEELEVLNYDLDSDFFFYLGEKIAKGCNVENENALITNFNTPDTEEDYKQIIAQWNELKSILFSDARNGEFEFTLPNGYIHWLRYSEKYNSVYDRNFSHGETAVITIDLEELYEDSIEYLQRKMLSALKQNELYLEIDEIVFNDDAVTNKTPIVCDIKNKYEDIIFTLFTEYNKDRTKLFPVLTPHLNIEIGKTYIFNIKVDNTKEFESLLGFLDDNSEISCEIGGFEFTINKEGLFTSCKISSESHMPELWSNSLGWSWDLNINEWIEILHSKNFIIYDIEEPCNNLLGRGHIYIQTPDCQYCIVINFHDKRAREIHINYLFKSVKNCDIAAKYLESREKDKKIYSNLETSPLSCLFPILGITLGDYHLETEQKYGTIEAASWIHFNLDKGIYQSVTMYKYPKEWEKIGINQNSSIDEVKEILIKLQFTYLPIEDEEFLEINELEGRKEINFSVDVEKEHYGLSIEYVSNKLKYIHISRISNFTKTMKEENDIYKSNSTSVEERLYSCPVCNGNLLKIGPVTYVCEECSRPWSHLFNSNCPNCESGNVISYTRHCACLDCDSGWTKGLEFMKCPTCHSDNIEDSGTSFLQFSCNDCNEIWGLADVMCPSCFKKNTRCISANKWHCDNCGHDFFE